MPGMMTFKILPTLSNKIKDLSSLFDTIIDEWGKGNPEKFGYAMGASETGIKVDPQVEWQALSPAYFKAKTRQGYPNQIMVRTGSLLASLSDPNRFFRMVEPEQAIFGTPNDPDDFMKMQYNWNTRQTIFLGDSDQNMIREKTQKYFTIQMQSTKQEVSEMDVNFANTIAP
jgi:hypothetical protein